MNMKTLKYLQTSEWKQFLASVTRFLHSIVKTVDAQDISLNNEYEGIENLSQPQLRNNNVQVFESVAPYCEDS